MSEGENESSGGGFREYDDYTTEELLEQARANAQAALIATIGYLRQQGLPIESWTDSIGHTFARGWEAAEGWNDAGEFLDSMLTNLRAIGADVLDADLGNAKAAATIKGFPDAELCALFETDPATVAKFHDASAVIARDLGLVWSWNLDDEGKTHITVERPSTSA
jgi:hypothetical protein